MRDPRPRLFLVQMTEHSTYEIELSARSDIDAQALASEIFQKAGPSAFTLVEQDVTDLTSCSLEAVQLDRPSLEAALVSKVDQDTEPSLVRTSHSISVSELHVIMTSLQEFRDTTLHQSTFDAVDRILNRLRSQSASHAIEG